MTTSLLIHEPGLQTTVQGAPRRGFRHLGVPASGAADPVALALANRLVGNTAETPGLEVTLSGLVVEATEEVSVGIAGAPCRVTIDGATAPPHRTSRVRAGEVIVLSAPARGCRAYLAIAGGVGVRPVLGSGSTYMPAGLGGFDGRALRAGDDLPLHGGPVPPEAETPADLRPPFGRDWTLRATPGPDASLLSPEDHARLFGEGWRASRIADRTGIRLDRADGEGLTHRDGVETAPTFPGTVQCPPGGAPILLGPDCGTTGGYPRAAQVIRADRHLFGQVRPGDGVRLLPWAEEDARAVLSEKTALLRPWLGPGFRL